MEPISLVLEIKVGDALITVDEDLQLHWHGAFPIGLAVYSLQFIEELLCLYGNCEKRQQLIQQDHGWIKFSDLYHGTSALQNRLERLPQSWNPTGKPSAASEKMHSLDGAIAPQL